MQRLVKEATSLTRRGRRLSVRSLRNLGFKVARPSKSVLYNTATDFVGCVPVSQARAQDGRVVRVPTHISGNIGRLSFTLSVSLERLARVKSPYSGAVHPVDRHLSISTSSVKISLTS